jgi:hypothetical protein
VGQHLLAYCEEAVRELTPSLKGMSLHVDVDTSAFYQHSGYTVIQRHGLAAMLFGNREVVMSKLL